MRRETCPNLTGFNYRGRILCATCIDKMIRADFEKRQAESFKQARFQQTKQNSKECEICGKLGVVKIGFSHLCENCALDVGACQHQNLEEDERLEDNYIVSRYLCRDCGVRLPTTMK